MADEFETSGEGPRESSPAGGFLRKKVGPLPVYGWVLVGGGVAMVLWLLHKRATGTPSAPGATVQPGDLGGGIPSNADQLNQQIGTLNGLLQEVVAKPGALNPPSSGVGVGAGSAGSDASGGPLLNAPAGFAFVPIQSAQEAVNAVATGLTVYWQPPGTNEYVPIPNADVYPGSGFAPTYILEPIAGGAAGAVGAPSGGSGSATQSTTGSTGPMKVPQGLRQPISPPTSGWT